MKGLPIPTHTANTTVTIKQLYAKNLCRWLNLFYHCQTGNLDHESIL